MCSGAGGAGSSGGTAGANGSGGSTFDPSTMLLDPFGQQKKTTGTNDPSSIPSPQDIK